MSLASHEGAYRSAMNAAMDELGRIHEEAIRVSNRMYQLDLLLEALKPFMRSGEQTAVEDRRPMYKSLESAAEPVCATGLTAQMVGSAIPEVVPQGSIESTGTIQRRINSVLGLAVA